MRRSICVLLFLLVFLAGCTSLSLRQLTLESIEIQESENDEDNALLYQAPISVEEAIKSRLSRIGCTQYDVSVVNSQWLVRYACEDKEDMRIKALLLRQGRFAIKDTASIIVIDNKAVKAAHVELSADGRTTLTITLDPASYQNLSNLVNLYHITSYSAELDGEAFPFVVSDIPADYKIVIHELKSKIEAEAAAIAVSYPYPHPLQEMAK